MGPYSIRVPTILQTYNKIVVQFCIAISMEYISGIYQ